MLSTYVDSVVVTPMVRTEDLIDAHDVAEILGLAQRNSVSTYLRRYLDMPRPVVERSGGRTRLWLRSEIEEWANARRKGAGPESRDEATSRTPSGP